MTISYPLTLPASPSFTELTFEPEDVDASSTSPFSLGRTVYEHQGERWRANFSLPPLTAAQARDWIGAFVSLNGQVGTFLLGDPNMAAPSGNGGGSPVVNGASQSGKVLSTRGWTASVTGILKRGDYFSISNRLYLVTKDANSDGSGIAALDIWPSLRQPAPADGTALVVTNPKGTFTLASPVSWNVTKEKTYTISISAIEPL